MNWHISGASAYSNTAAAWAGASSLSARMEAIQQWGQVMPAQCRNTRFDIYFAMVGVLEPF
jgi:hypothetical protein